MRPGKLNEMTKADVQQPDSQRRPETGAHGLDGMFQRLLDSGLYAAWLQFLISYRRTALGPIWLLIGPSLFVGVLGFLYAEIGATDPAVFIPHLAVGLVSWTLISQLINQSVTVLQRSRSQILQGGRTLSDIVTVDIVKTFLTFLHQIPIIVAVMLIYRVPMHWTAFESIVGLGLIIANGYWFALAFGILGARYRDLSEVFQAVMRIAFLATPIIWMPGEGGRGSVMSTFTAINPFYHFLEVIRAPLLGSDVSPLSWAVVLTITTIGFALSRLTTARYARYVALWV